MKKFFVLICSVILVFSLLSIVSLAEESAISPVAESITSDEKSAPWSETVVAWLSNNIESIFSGASLGGVALLMFLFKKGLIPTVGAAVSKIADTVGAAKDKLGEVAEGTSAEMKAFVDKFSPVLEKLEQYTLVFDAAIRQISAAKSEREVMISTLEESNMLLLSMIEASRLPESVKEKARLAKTKQDACIEALRSNCNATEEGGEAE